MKPPRHRLTVQALVVVAALFALDFGGIAWVVRHEPDGVRVGLWAQVAQELIAPVFFIFVPFLLLSALIYLYRAHGFFASAFATSFLISSPRIPRATILPSGPTSTKAGIARMPNVPGVGPWMPPPRKACDHGSRRLSWNFFGSSIFSSTLRLRIANRSSLPKAL
jgi:hypothetical protein